MLSFKATAPGLRWTEGRETRWRGAAGLRREGQGHPKGQIRSTVRGRGHRARVCAGSRGKGSREGVSHVQGFCLGKKGARAHKMPGAWTTATQGGPAVRPVYPISALLPVTTPDPVSLPAWTLESKRVGVQCGLCRWRSSSCRTPDQRLGDFSNRRVFPRVPRG